MQGAWLWILALKDAQRNQRSLGKQEISCAVHGCSLFMFARSPLMTWSPYIAKTIENHLPDSLTEVPKQIQLSVRCLRYFHSKFGLPVHQFPCLHLQLAHLDTVTSPCSRLEVGEDGSLSMRTFLVGACTGGILVSRPQLRASGHIRTSASKQE